MTGGGAFVTGGSGFVGGALVRRLVADGVRVRALARSDAAASVVRELGAEPVEGTILDEDVLREAVRGCDVVFHAAGVNLACVRDPGPMYAANVSGPERVIRAAAAAGVPRVVHTSSAAAVAEREGEVGREDTEPSGSFHTHYARSKYLGERRAFAVGRETGVEVVCVNPSSVQGPRRLTGTARILVRVAGSRTAVVVPTWLSVVDVDDCAAGHVLAARRGAAGERYLLSGASLSTDDAVDLLRRVTGGPRRVLRIPRAVLAAASPLTALVARAGGDDPPLCPGLVRTLLHGHRYDASRAERELGVRYTPVEETLRRTLDWYRDRGMLGSSAPA